MKASGRRCDSCGRPALSTVDHRRKHSPYTKGPKWRKGHDLCDRCFDELMESLKLKTNW